jgi:hypothetical protein
VGFGSSTFSFFLREYRALHGIPKHTSAFLNVPRIGTEAMFSKAAVVTEGKGSEHDLLINVTIIPPPDAPGEVHG